MIIIIFLNLRNLKTDRKFFFFKLFLLKDFLRKPYLRDGCFCQQENFLSGLLY